MARKALPFSLCFSDKLQSPLLKAGMRTIEPLLEKVLGLSRLNHLYLQAQNLPANQAFTERSLSLLEIGYSLPDDALERIPETGPLIIVANHPFGAIEGIVLADLLRKLRPDTKILANFLIGRVPEVTEHFIYVDPFDSDTSIKKNRQPMRDAVRWLNKGGLLVIFPSGTVSHYQPKQRRVTDPQWHSSVARLIRQTKSPVVPIFFEGQNSWLFQFAGLIHPLLRTVLLPHECCNKRSSTIHLKVGRIISPEKIRRFSSDEELMSYLRLRTYVLASSRKETLPLIEKTEVLESAEVTKELEPLIEAIDPILMQAEIDRIPGEQVLDKSNDYLVAYAKADQIPFTLREIGRLREQTFRLVQEGTGRSIDLDRFDNYYLHLFVWNNAEKELVGAYRLAHADRVLENFGIRGLYSHTLFDYSPELLRQMGPAIELGRSFVRSKYQRNYNSLNLLWRGIALFAAKFPEYRILFGTVSISSEYESISRQLIMSFLKANNYLPELARLIRARNPMKRVPLHGLDSASKVVKDIQGVSELIREIEANHRGIPVLLKQYLRLGGKLLGFNIDKNFGNVLDGLIYVDLCETDPKILERYLGKAGLEKFLSSHNSASKLDKTGTCD